jgi:hypothetical protein
MNMIERFPANTRHEVEINIRKRNSLSRKLSSSESQKLAQFYKDEFRKWHYKFAFILISCLAAVYLFIANISGVIQWIASSVRA